MRRCAFCLASSARRCSRSTASAGRSTDRHSDGPRPERLAALQQCATISMRSPARPPARSSGLCRFGQEIRSEAGGFSRHRRWHEMDVRGYPRPDLPRSTVCDRVGARLDGCRCGVFGCRPMTASLLAHHLGRALQWTTSSRHDEDAGLEIVLPAKDCWRGHHRETILDVNRSALAGTCTRVARARSIWNKSEEVMARIRPSGRAPRIMSKYYGTILRC